MMTAREFVRELEKAIVKVVDGEHEHVPFTSGVIMANVQPEEQGKITRQYICSTINRVPEVKAVGKASLKIKRTEDGITEYTLTVNRNPKRRVLTSDDTAAIQAVAVRKVVRGFLERPPTVADLEGEQLEGAMIMMRRFNAMFNEIVKEGE